MNRVYIAAFLLLVSHPLSAEPARFLPLKDFVEDWKISKQFTIAVAQKMPAKDYSFKASPDERSFGEQMVHIGAALFERFSQISGIAPVKKRVPVIITKEFAIQWLNQSFDYAIEVLPKLNDEQLEARRVQS